MSDQMTQDQFQQLMNRLDQVDARIKHVEDNMVRKSDVFQSVLTVQGFTIAVIVGAIVVLNTLVGFSS